MSIQSHCFFTITLTISNVTMYLAPESAAEFDKVLTTQ